jgi:HAD superfamily hydrolase (TIGR01509 family)
MGRHRIRGVVWDLDGTLTVPILDFARMRQRTGILTGDLLEHADAAAMAIIEEMEAEAAANMQLQHRCLDILGHVHDTLQLPMAILTRNSAASAQRFVTAVAEKVHFAHVLSRDHPPFKPSPHNLLKMAATWRCPPHELLMVGDARDDVLAGWRAGTKTILIANHPHPSPHSATMHNNHSGVARILQQLQDSRTPEEVASGVKIEPTLVIGQLADFEAAFAEHFEAVRESTS